jgi:hypothetical protein
MIEEHLSFPFETAVLSVTVTVERVDITADGRIVAVCSRGHHKQSIPILDLPIPVPHPAGAEWIEAYRLWARRSWQAGTLQPGDE